MTVFGEPKIDCHCHILDPDRFPYGTDTPYRPAGQEIGTANQMRHVFGTYGIQRALLVQPNSGYGFDNSAMMDAIANSGGRYKGIAVVPLDVDIDRLAELKSNGIVGVAWNLPFHGVPYYLNTAPLLEKLAALDMFVQVQTDEDQLLSVLPLLDRHPVRILIDHCGRPVLANGIQQPGFQAVLALGRSGRAAVKLSGYSKFSRQGHPFEDCWPYVRALVDAFTLDNCLWASDWPFLRAPERVDVGPLLKLVETLFPDAADRRKLFWGTPARLFGFG
jgi:predicted TIM-barrel fold metal-dependent hydrolase